MSTNSLTEKQLSAGFIFCLICYFGLHILLRVSISDSLEFDEAEQALLSQWLRPGYTEQPPLYTWIQHYLFQIFGKNVFAVSLLKNSLLCLTYTCIFFSGRILFKSTKPAILAACSLLLIPQIGWESQRDMTHTTLVVFAASATLLQCLRMINKQKLRDYILLGILLSVGILSKVNFILFLSILSCCLLSLPEGRRFLLSPKMVVVLLIIVVSTGPYFHWMYTNQDIVFSATHKFNRATEQYYVKGTGSLFYNSFLFLTPLWLIYLLMFPSGFALKPGNHHGFSQKMFLRYLQFFIVILLAIVLLFKVTYVKDRWLQPILFVVPLFFFSRLNPTKISAKRFKYFIIAILLVAVGVYSAFTLRVVGATYFGFLEPSHFERFCRMNYPITKMVSEMREAGFSEGLIISNDRFLAGNMLFQFPDSAVIIPNYRFEDLIRERNFTKAAIVWDGDYHPQIPQTLVSYMRKNFKYEEVRYPASYYNHTYNYGRNEKVTLAVIYLSLLETDNTSALHKSQQ